MKFIQEILERATIRGVADYILYGIKTDEDTRDYKTRLNKAYLKYEKLVFLYDKSTNTKLLKLANEMNYVTAHVYTEIGLQAGILLSNDTISNIKRGGEEEDRANYQEMSDSLFRDVTKALKYLQCSEDDNGRKALKILELAQYKADETYIGTNNE